MAVLGAVLVGVAWFRFNQFDRVDLSLVRREPDRPINFLMVGSDSRDGISGDDADADAFLAGDVEIGGKRTDTIMVVRVDPRSSHVDILSIPRDLWVPIGDGGESQRINAAYAGGPQQLIDTVRSVLQVDVNHYVEIDFRGFQQLVDTIGGVPMYFDTPMRDENSGLAIGAAGCVKLDGTQALAFARSRSLEYYDASTDSWYTDPTADLGRITRQQLFLRRAMDKVATLGLTDVGRLNRLVSVGTDNVKFDDGMKTTELVSLIRKFASANGDAISSYSLPTEPFETDDGSQVLLLRQTEAQPMLDVFRGVAVAPTSTTLLTPAQVAISVLNGTGVSGQAGDAATTLGEAGFVVAKVGDAPAVGEPTTTLRYGSGRRAEAELVATFLQPGVVLTEDAAAGKGVVLTTGADFRGVTLPTEPTVAVDAPTTTAAIGVAPPAQAPPGERECS